VTTHADSPSTPDRIGSARPLVVVLLAMVCLVSGYSGAAAASPSDLHEATTSTSDELALAGTADATKQQRTKQHRSSVRRRTRRRPALPVIAVVNQRGTTPPRWRLRCVALMAPMWRGPPVLQP